MNCNEAADLLSAHVDDELTAEARNPLLEHLANCSLCARKLSELERVTQATRVVLSPPSIPHARIAQRVAAQLDRGFSKPPHPVSLLATAVAGAAASFLALNLVLRSASKEQTAPGTPHTIEHVMNDVLTLGASSSPHTHLEAWPAPAAALRLQSLMNEAQVRSPR